MCFQKMRMTLCPRYDESVAQNPAWTFIGYQQCDEAMQQNSAVGECGMGILPLHSETDYMVCNKCMGRRVEEEEKEETRLDEAQRMVDQESQRPQDQQLQARQAIQQLRRYLRPARAQSWAHGWGQGRARL